MDEANSIDSDIARYLATGESDSMGALYPAEHLLAALTRYDSALRQALIAKVRRGERGHPQARLPVGMAPVAFTRRKLEPMVKGLFPAKERKVVLGVLEQATVFLTSDNIHRLIEETTWPKTAWDLANIYLASIGASPLSEGDGHIVGLSEETTCFVSMEYFEAVDPFADFVVHEAAHVFHNSKRRTVGLPFTRYREWMLNIDFTKRETFAYGCEAYSRILDHAHGPKQRRQQLAEYARGSMPADDRVDPDELVDILEEAVAARNGWKRIAKRCAPPKKASPELVSKRSSRAPL